MRSLPMWILILLALAAGGGFLAQRSWTMAGALRKGISRAGNKVREHKKGGPMKTEIATFGGG